MSEPVKRRSYDSSRRRAQASATQAEIVRRTSLSGATVSTIAYRDLGPFDLKGIDEPMRIFQAA